MDSVNLMDVRQVTVRKIRHFPKTERRIFEFYSREFIFHKQDGSRISITAFADKHEELMLLDGDREPLERMPDPPDCPVCKGTGNSYNADSDTNDCCHACNGEGVAQF